MREDVGAIVQYIPLTRQLVGNTRDVREKYS